MKIEAMSSLPCILAILVPFTLLIGGCLPSLLRLDNRRAAHMGASLAMMAFCLAVLAAVARSVLGPSEIQLPIWGPIRVGIYFDTLSAVMLVLVSFLLATVARYSVNYLDGDPAQGRFFRWLCLTGSSVLALVISGNLLQFTLFWSLTSLCLHQLLVFYSERPGAVLAARKKFIISRMGDMCLAATLVLVHFEFRTWDFSALFLAAERLHSQPAGSGTAALTAICFLLVLGAMLKSAQFPFHSWLPDTMETPTPVSALMHAGVINAGGFLVIRLHPLITLSSGALSLLALLGAFTALFASLTMLTHASVKRSLAFSTIAQMGYMMLQCGLGAFGLALLHIVAHSLYKAHAFLSSGSIVQLGKAAWTPSVQPRADRSALAGAFVTASALTLLGIGLFRIDFRHEPGLLVLVPALTMGLSYALWNFWGQALNPRTVAVGVLATALLLLVSFSLHHVANQLINSRAWLNEQMATWPGLLLMFGLLLLFLFTLVFQSKLPQWSKHPFFCRMYVHARNGFYFNTIANRCVSAIWPVKL